MSVSRKIQARIDHEEERLHNLEATLPTLKRRLELAEQHADQVEAALLLQEAADGVIETKGDTTESSLQHAKRAERERRRAVESTEREIRLARILRDELKKTLAHVEEQDVDGKLRDLEERVPKIAEKLADAWLAFEAIAREADEIKREQKRLKALVPIKGIPVSLDRPIPTIPALEHLRHKRPGDAMGHPAKVLQNLGYDDLAEKVKGAA